MDTPNRTLEIGMQFQLLKYQGLLDDSNLSGRVLDFGAGYGIGTAALKDFGGDVEAVEKHTISAEEIVKRNILPQNRVYAQDGIDFLVQRPRTYDLIAAILFGPFPPWEDNMPFLRRFYNAANNALTPTGKIVVTSDIGSFQCFDKMASESLGQTYKFEGFPPVFIASHKDSVKKSEDFAEYLKKFPFKHYMK